MKLDRLKLQSGRAVCPKCQKKGVGYASHAHAYGYKDYERAQCRYCKSRFALVRPLEKIDVKPVD